MKTVILREYGIVPGEDCTLALAELFANNKCDTEFVFEDGEYFFTPKITRDLRLSNTDVLPIRKLGVLLDGMKNVTLTGNGARLLYAGQMQAVTMLDCENVVMKDFVIDWKKPLVSEGIVREFGEDYVDLYIDPVAFPHRVGENNVEFDLGNDEWAEVKTWGQMQFDAETLTVRRTTGDNFSLGGLVCERGDNVYRFAANHPNTAIGNIVVLRHNERQHAGIFTEKCKNITIEEVNVYSCGGLGCLAQFCDTLTYRRVNFTPNKEAGRKVVNGRDDGMHITCCSGTVTITECSFLGLMDDPINVHSCCVTGVEWLDERTLRCRYMHHQACAFLYWAKAGDDIVFIDRASMTQTAHATAESYTLESNALFTIKFDSPVSEEIRSRNPVSLSLDNMTNTAAFVCTNNRFGSCRARGILVSTPKPVRIANNLFQSSGSAILVAGDSNYWYESGECHDVEICGNVFTDSCLSSMYQFCEGIISVCPVVPKPDTKTPYHKNIRIHDNVFDTPDTPVLYAFSTDGLYFTNNRIFKSTSAEKWHPGDSLIKLSYCRNVVCRDNDWTGEFSIKRVSTSNCENTEV